MYSIKRNSPRSSRPPPVRGEDDALLWLNKFRFAAEFRDENGHPTVPIARFCEYAGVSRVSVYRFMRGFPVGPLFKARLLVAIEAVRSGLRWKRQADHSYVANDPVQFRKLPRYERPSKLKEGDAA